MFCAAFGLVILVTESQAFDTISVAVTAFDIVLVIFVTQSQAFDIVLAIFATQSSRHLTLFFCLFVFYSETRMTASVLKHDLNT